MSGADDGFLARWAKRKARVQSGIAEAVEAPLPPVESPALAVRPEPSAVAVPVPAEAQQAATPEPIPLPTMEDVALLTRSSDYSRFVGPGVDSGVSNAAMKKLFSDPHFNVMDGLDTYIDDYGKPDPIPMSMLRQMNQAKFLGLFDAEDDQSKPDNANNGAAAPASTDGAAAPAVAQSLPLEQSRPIACAPEAPADDDPDLRLQQDDGAERPGLAPGPGA